MKQYTTYQALKIINRDREKIGKKAISLRRLQAMLKQDQNPNRRVTHFPNAIKHPIKFAWLIPAADLTKLKNQTAATPESNISDIPASCSFS